MTGQTSNLLLFVGAILGSLGFVGFAALMAAGGVEVSPVAFLATVIALAAGIVLFSRFRRHGAKGAPASAERHPASRSAEPGSAGVAAGVGVSSVPARTPTPVEGVADESSTSHAPQSEVAGTGRVSGGNIRHPETTVEQPGTATELAGTGAEPDKVKSGTPLKDEQEPATRKGSWAYERSAAAGVTGSEAPDEAPVSGGQDAVGTMIGVEPARLGEAREGGPDDLKRIKGIGPKLEEILHRMGIFHYDQIATWNDREVSWIDENLKGFRGRVSRDGWVDQARCLAAGGKAELPRQAGGGGRG